MRWLAGAIACAIAITIATPAQAALHGASVPADRIVVTGAALDAAGQPMAGMDVALYRILTSREKAKRLEGGDLEIAKTVTRADGSYSFSRKATRTGASYAVLFLVDSDQAARGYYSSWAKQPRSWESLVVPTNGDALAYWGIDAAPGSSFRVDPGQSYALGARKLALGGRLNGLVNCPGVTSNSGDVMIAGATSMTRPISASIRIGASGKVRPRFSLPTGTYEVSSAVSRCRYGKDPVMGYSAMTRVTVKTATIDFAVTKAPVKAVRSPRIIGTVRAGNTIRVSAAWPSGTRAKYFYFDGGGWVKFSPSALRIPKRLQGKTLKILIRSDFTGHFAGVTWLKARVR